MVHIHAEFKNVDEMLEFARRLSGLAGVQSAGAVTESYAQEPPATSLTMSAQEGQTPVQQPEKAPSTPVVVPTTQVPAASTVSQAAGGRRRDGCRALRRDHRKLGRTCGQ